GLITFASPAVETLIGRVPEEVVGTPATTYIHPDERERVSAQLTTRFADRSVTDPIQFRMGHADGTWRFVEAVVSDLRSRPSVRGYVANLRDMTERAEAQ